MAKVRKAFRFSIETGHKLRKLAEGRGHSKTYTLTCLIEEHWAREFRATGITLESMEGTYDWGYRANSCQIRNQVRYIHNFRMDQETVGMLAALAKIGKESQARVCEGLIGLEYEMLHAS